MTDAAPQPEPVRVLLADDQRLVRESLGTLPGSSPSSTHKFMFSHLYSAAVPVKVLKVRVQSMSNRFVQKPKHFTHCLSFKPHNVKAYVLQSTLKY